MNKFFLPVVGTMRPRVVRIGGRVVTARSVVGLNSMQGLLTPSVQIFLHVFNGCQLKCCQVKDTTKTRTKLGIGARK